jgi:hypothetical protein
MQAILGFSGTRMGFSFFQRSFVQLFLQQNNIQVVLHGDCAGSDSEFHHEVRKWTKAEIWICPPIKNVVRAYENGDKIFPEKGYLARDRSIVHYSNLLLATPLNKNQKGGTWYTINYAKSLKKPVLIVYPDSEAELFDENQIVADKNYERFVYA